jgi:hypothetical protein
VLISDKNFNLDLLFSSCAFTADFWAIQAFKVLLPLISFLLLVLISGVAYLIQFVRKPNDLHSRKVANPFERAFSLYIGAGIGLQTYLISIGLAPFRCFQQLDGTYTLVSASKYNCYDSEWRSHGLVISIGLIQIGLPIIALVVIFCLAKSRRQENSFMWVFGMLMFNYKDQFYWWEGVLVVKKVAFVMIVDLMNGYNRHLRVFLAEGVLIAGVFLETLCQPRVDLSVSRILHPM